jgi:hypothetical protein
LWSSCAIKAVTRSNPIPEILGNYFQISKCEEGRKLDPQRGVKIAEKK